MTDGSADDSDASISAAIAHLETEQSRLSDERTAFERFSARVETIAPGRVDPTEGMIQYEQQTSGQTLLAVREAYTETVMDVSHYDEEYDDTYQESITAEFGPELAVALTQSSRFTPATKSTLLGEIDEAISQREAFQEAVERELNSLRSAATEVRSISNTVARLSETEFPAATFGALDAYLHQTDVLTAACDDIAERRQDDLAAIERSWGSPVTSLDLQTYFYQSLPVTYPVLARLGELGARIVALREEIEQAIIYQVEP